MLSTLDYANIGVTASAVTSYMYVLYVALKVRQSLAVGQYRRHALGIGIVAIVFVADQVSNFFPALNTGIWNYLGLATFAAFALGLLYWVDSSVLAARRSDPLYRDTFHWSKLRWVAWGASVAAFVFVIGTSLALPPPHLHSGDLRSCCHSISRPSVQGLRLQEAFGVVLPLHRDTVDLGRRRRSTFPVTLGDLHYIFSNRWDRPASRPLSALSERQEAGSTVQVLHRR